MLHHWFVQLRSHPSRIILYELEASPLGKRASVEVMFGPRLDSANDDV